MNVIDDERFIKVQSILEFSDIHPEDCTKINDLIIELSKERNQFKEYTNHNYDKAKQLEEKNRELKKFNDKLLIHNASLMYAQKEFINYINAYIVLLNDKLDVLEEVQKDILEEILQKYKKIIGLVEEVK